MAHVLIVHESESARSELARELLAEGFTVAEAETASVAVRDLWQGNFVAALIGDKVPGINGVSLEEHLHNLAPEVVTLLVGKDPPAKITRKLADILDGAAAA